MNVQYFNLSATPRDVTYVGAYIPILIERSGMTVTDDAHIILCTVSDVDAWPKLRALRNRNKEKIIIVGGFEAYVGEWMLAYADFVVAGKGERFINEMGKNREIPEDLPEVYTTRTFKNKACIPYEHNDFSTYPVIKTSRGRCYAVVGFGCKAKCDFCLTSWAQGYRVAQRSLCNSLIRRAQARKIKITLVRNDYDAETTGLKNVNAQSMRVADFLKAKKIKGGGLSTLHIGIEGLTEATRKKLRKPISNLEIKETIYKLGVLKLRAELFFISGIPGDGNLQDLKCLFEIERAKSPPVHLKFTTLNPVPHTPLWTMNLRDIGEITQQDIDLWYEKFILKTNRRIRTFSTRTPSRELWRAMMRRCLPDEVEKLGKPPDAFTPSKEYLDVVESKGLVHLICPSGILANSHIITPNRSRMAMSAVRWGLLPPIYRDVEGS